MPQSAQQPASHTIDVAFHIAGDRIPVDHGYALYAALSNAPGVGAWLHRAPHVGIHPIRGQYPAPGLLSLTPKSRLTLRLAAAELPYILPLAGQAIELAGHGLCIGVPQTTLLRPAACLYAHAVTTRNGQNEVRFDAEIARQLDEMEIQGKPTRGKRRVLRIKDKTVVAHSLLVSELTAEDSIHLQEAGLGGRRKMGCGVFVPWRA
jgi:CRISPR-associated protein Cas6